MHTFAGTVSDTVLENQTGRVRALLAAVQPNQSATGKLALFLTIIMKAAAATIDQLHDVAADGEHYYRAT